MAEKSDDLLVNPFLHLLGREPQDPPAPPAEPICFPLDRRDIALVWHNNMWVWAVVRAPSRGRPQKGMSGIWLGSTVFVPWTAGSSGIGLGLPPCFPNSFDDALRAAADLRTKPKPRPRLTGQLIRKSLGFGARLGRPRNWTSDERERLLRIVLQQAAPDGKIPERIFRNHDLRKAFGQRSASAIRRQFYVAWRAFKDDLAANQVKGDFPE